MFNLFNRKPSKEELTQEEFSKALQILSEFGGRAEDCELVNKMVEAGIAEQKAIELYLFIPTAFCRELFTGRLRLTILGIWVRNLSGKMNWMHSHLNGLITYLNGVFFKWALSS